jgi:hypothetical protein
MKTDTTKLFDDMIAEDVKQETAGLSDSAKIEKTINDAMQKMQESFTEKLNAAAEHVNNIMNKEDVEDGNTEEEEQHTGDNGGEDLPNE